MFDTETSVSGGLLESIRTLGDSVLDTVHDRLELFFIELHEEKFRLIQTFIWISACVFAAIMAVTFASLTIVYLFWESARLAVLIGLTLFYVAGFVGSLVALMRFLKKIPRPFAATLEEMREDRACIRAKS